jgi:tetratricopeptide (TPR) repeat protein
MTTTMKLLIAFLLALSVTAHTGCSSSTDDDEKSPEQLVDEGWQAFGSGNYSEAASRFDEAITKNGNYVEAYDGAGWSYSKLGSLTPAENRFLTGFRKDSTNYEIRAGLAFLYHAQQRYIESAQLIEMLLGQGANWTFRGDASIGMDDVRLLLAEDYFALANYAECIAHVQILNPAFTADVTTVSGQAALAQEIERLKTIV